MSHTNTRIPSPFNLGASLSLVTVVVIFRTGSSPIVGHLYQRLGNHAIYRAEQSSM
ncbi:hypothetical protein BDR04DRAFT_1089020, partial [Suillus decipiens]